MRPIEKFDSEFTLAERIPGGIQIEGEASIEWLCHHSIDTAGVGPFPK